MAIFEATADTLKKSDSAVVLDLGAMMSMGLCVVGALMEEKGLTKNVKLVATNEDLRFTVKNAIAEAAHRLDRRTKERFAASGQRLKPLLNMEELRFVAQHVKHVVFESGIDTLDLSVLKQKHAPNGFSIIHEHSGGLQKHENPSEAFSTILDVLHPQNGMFITTSPIDVLPGAVADIQNHGFTLYREIISQQKLFKEAYIITGSEAPVDAFMTTLLTY